MSIWLPEPGTPRAFFRGNGTNVVKIAPETAIKLSCNDRIKRAICTDLDEITPAQRYGHRARSRAPSQQVRRVNSGSYRCRRVLRAWVPMAGAVLSAVNCQDSTCSRSLCVSMRRRGLQRLGC